VSESLRSFEGPLVPARSVFGYYTKNQLEKNQRAWGEETYLQISRNFEGLCSMFIQS
jgi:hypothetical protein